MKEHLQGLFRQAMNSAPHVDGDHRQSPAAAFLEDAIHEYATWYGEPAARQIVEAAAARIPPAPETFEPKPPKPKKAAGGEPKGKEPEKQPEA